MISVKLFLNETQYVILKPDIEGKYGRAKVSIGRNEGDFYIYIEAPDTGSLRTSLSSIARLFHVMDSVEGLING
ncbi:KEOPS complex subunit Pcc1 [Thermoplasma sp.]|uniref:KEOPS complex subunit Pcc1 n=1 Tax=Thermoplasma sp. TaxID=1973142 RepID=UPI001273404D|nr:KEOPS complex subunit Pcc1 [Thermoplasma sp.]KAA8922285.1 MAG: hypothetical protein F6Q11_05235 [Thermoplasma sp.]